GHHSFEMEPPAEKRATSTPSKTSGERAWTVYSVPAKRTFLPALRGEATGTSSPTGNLRSSSTRSIRWPTAPVMPTTATFSDFVMRQRYTASPSRRQFAPRLPSYHLVHAGWSPRPFDETLVPQ